MIKKTVVNKKYLENEVKKLLISENDWCQAFGLCDPLPSFGSPSRINALKELDALAATTEAWYEDQIVQGNNILIKALTATGEGATNAVLGAYGTFEEAASAINKTVFYGGNDILQAISRIESTDTRYIPKVKNFFKLFNVRCNKESVLKSLPAFGRSRLGITPFNDPGNYCINEDLAKALDSFYQKRRSSFIKKLLDTRNEQQRKKLYKREAYKLYEAVYKIGGKLSGNRMITIDNSDKIISLLASDEFNELEELKQGQVREDPFDDESDLINAYCGFDFLFAALDQVDVTKEEIEDYYARIAQRKSENWSHFLDNTYKKKIFVKRLMNDNRFYQKWFVFTLVMIFDPYGSRLFGEWETMMKSMAEKLSEEQQSYAKMGGNLLASFSIMYTESEVLISGSKLATKHLAPGFAARIGLAGAEAGASGGMTPASLIIFAAIMVHMSLSYFKPFGMFTETDELKSHFDRAQIILTNAAKRLKKFNKNPSAEKLISITKEKLPDKQKNQDPIGPIKGNPFRDPNIKRWDSLEAGREVEICGTLTGGPPPKPCEELEKEWCEKNPDHIDCAWLKIGPNSEGGPSGSRVSGPGIGGRMISDDDYVGGLTNALEYEITSFHIDSKKQLKAFLKTISARLKVEFKGVINILQNAAKEVMNQDMTLGLASKEKVQAKVEAGIMINSAIQELRNAVNFNNDMFFIAMPKDRLELEKVITVFNQSAEWIKNNKGDFNKNLEAFEVGGRPMRGASFTIDENKKSINTNLIMEQLKAFDVKDNSDIDLMANAFGMPKWDDTKAVPLAARAKAIYKKLTTKQIQAFTTKYNEVKPADNGGLSAFNTGPGEKGASFKGLWDSEYTKWGVENSVNFSSQNPIMDTNWFKKNGGGIWRADGLRQVFDYSPVHAVALLGPKNGWSHTRFDYTQNPMMGLYRLDSLGLKPVKPADRGKRIKFLKDQLPKYYYVGNQSNIDTLKNEIKDEWDELDSGVDHDAWIKWVLGSYWHYLNTVATGLTLLLEKDSKATKRLRVADAAMYKAFYKQGGPKKKTTKQWRRLFNEMQASAGIKLQCFYAFTNLVKYMKQIGLDVTLR